MALQRILGTATALLIGMGVAIGSGIFRTPGDIAGHLRTPWLILLAWVVGGLIVLMQGMVTAEIATRFPEAGGEYVFLREAYGRFVAFFFGWSYTVFVIGAGSAVIAIALGEFACELFHVPGEWTGAFAAASIAAVTGVNVIGLRTGAGTQNVLTCLKITALLGVVVVGFAFGGSPTETTAGLQPTPPSSMLGMWIAAILPVLWSYDGTTDSVKMAEEVRDVRRALPRAVIGSTVALTLLYALVNMTLLRIVPADEMAGLASVPGEAMFRVFGPSGRTAMLLAAILVCLGSISSTIPATVRVTFALARDGLTFRFLSKMSKGQAPVPALLTVSAIAIAFSLNRSFRSALDVYFLASAVLFGLSYGSLILFRARESSFPANAFRCPFGVVLASILIVIQGAIALHIAIRQPVDALYTVSILVVLGILYFLWRRWSPNPTENPRS